MRLINQWGSRVSDRVRRELPEVEVLDLAVGTFPPDGSTADGLFAADEDWDSPTSPIEICRRHEIGWIQVSSAGIDRIPPALFENGRIVTTGRASAAVGISEFV